MDGPSVTEMLFAFIGGLGLLLFGMAQMSDGLRKAAGKKARQVLELLTSNVLKSVGVGALVTCIIQSSSATTVMVVGFVNAGLMKLRQAIGTIMGANIGTTITAWLVSIFAALQHAKISKYGLPMVGVGFIAHALDRPRGTRHWGQVLLGLGLIILGLGHMKGGFSHLTEQRGDPSLIVREIVDWPGFCLRLNRDGNDERPNPGARIWQLLPEGAQKAIRKAAQGKGLDEAGKKRVVDALNETLKGRDFYAEEAFKIVVLSDEAKELLKGDPRALSEADVRRLNRLLLEASYPDQIAKGQGRLQKIFASFAEVPLWGFIVGALITGIVQSSSATISIVQILAATGVVTFEAALPLVLGTNLGTCVTALLASLGANTNAKRAAWAHVLFNSFGVFYLFCLVPLALLVRAVVPGDISLSNIAVHIAVAHTMVNVLSTLIFTPLVDRLESLVVRLVPGDGDEVTGDPQFLEKRLLDSPPLALDCAKKEILRMMEIAQDAMDSAMAGLLGSKKKAMKRVAQREDAIDQLQSEITEYLVELSRRDLEITEASEFPTLIHVVNDIERIGDHAVNIAELAETYRRDKLSFSTAAARDLRKFSDEASAMMKESIEALDSNNTELARAALQREETINTWQVDCRKSYGARLSRKRHDVAAGLIFLDVISNLEKIADHLTNINQAVLGAFHWEEKYEMEDQESQ